MYSYRENPDLYSIISPCLNLLQSKQARFQKTKSQIPATSSLWFVEVDLKKITTITEFLTWVKETFHPLFELHKCDSNKHVAILFNTLAQEISKQVQRSQYINQENQQLISNMFDEKCSLTPELHYDDPEGQEHWSNTVLKSSQ